MCDGVVDDCLATLKFIPDCLVTSKILEQFHDTLLANNILLFDEDFSKVTFFANDLDKISLVDVNNFYEDDPESIISMSDFWLAIINEKRTHLKKIYAKN